MLAELVRLAELETQSRAVNAPAERTIALVPSTAHEMASMTEVFVRDADPAEVRQFLLFLWGLVAKPAVPETDEAPPEDAPPTEDETPAEPAPLTEEGEPT